MSKSDCLKNTRGPILDAKKTHWKKNNGNIVLTVILVVSFFHQELALKKTCLSTSTCICNVYARLLSACLIWDVSIFDILKRDTSTKDVSNTFRKDVSNFQSKIRAFVIKGIFACTICIKYATNYVTFATYRFCVLRNLFKNARKSWTCF